jgi:hypothetical protein
MLWTLPKKTVFPFLDTKPDPGKTTPAYPKGYRWNLPGPNISSGKSRQGIISPLKRSHHEKDSKQCLTEKQGVRKKDAEDSSGVGYKLP